MPRGPSSKEEMEACAAAGIKYIELPVAFDALTVVVNPQNTWAKSLTAADLAEDVGAELRRAASPSGTRCAGFARAAADAVRPGRRLRHLRLLHRSRERQGQGQPRRTYTASEDDNVLVQGVENNKSAHRLLRLRLLHRATRSEMRAVPIMNPKGKEVGPSIEAVNDGSYKPLSRPLFIYVRDTARGPRRGEGIHPVLPERGRRPRQGSGLCPAAGRTPISVALKHFTDKKLGTVFGGVPEVGVTIDALLAREGKL